MFIGLVVFIYGIVADLKCNGFTTETFISHSTKKVYSFSVHIVMECKSAMALYISRQPNLL